jgi:hypothetical protein
MLDTSASDPCHLANGDDHTQPRGIATLEYLINMFLSVQKK